MFLCAMAGLSSAVDVSGSAVDNAELKAMLLELQAHLAEINSTLHSQTRVDAAQMCQSLGVGLASTAGKFSITDFYFEPARLVTKL